MSRRLLPADPPRRFVRFAWLVLVANLGVILWGAVVRATGSGAGCGSHWPLCNGEVVPRSPSVATLIEYSHRLTSGLALILVVALAVWAWRAFPAGSPVRLGGVLSLVFMLGEAAIGAGLVLFELVADNESMARALFMGTHLGNTFLLLATLSLTAYWAEGGPALSFTGQGRLSWLVPLALGAALLIGMSGAVAALGDTLYPAASLSEGIAQDLSPTSHILVQLRVLHPLIAVSGSLLLLYLASVARAERGALARRYGRLLNLLVVAQLAVGTFNVATLAPTFLQVVHLLLADLVWIALVLTSAASLAQSPEPAAVAAPAVARA